MLWPHLNPLQSRGFYQHIFGSLSFGKGWGEAYYALSNNERLTPISNPLSSARPFSLPIAEYP